MRKVRYLDIASWVLPEIVSEILSQNFDEVQMLHWKSCLPNSGIDYQQCFPKLRILCLLDFQLVPSSFQHVETVYQRFWSYLTCEDFNDDCFAQQESNIFQAKNVIFDICLDIVSEKNQGLGLVKTCGKMKRYLESFLQGNQVENVVLVTHPSIAEKILPEGNYQVHIVENIDEADEKGYRIWVENPPVSL